MDLFKSASAMVTRSFKPKKHNKTRKTHSSKKSSRSARSSRSSKSSYESLHGSPKTQTEIVRKNIIKKYKKLGVDKKSIDILNKNIQDLEEKGSIFRKTKKNMPKSKSRSPKLSPLVITIKNLNTGIQEEATVIKNLDTNKYEFVGLK